MVEGGVGGRLVDDAKSGEPFLVPHGTPPKREVNSLPKPPDSRVFIKKIGSSTETTPPQPASRTIVAIPWLKPTEDWSLSEWQCTIELSWPVLEWMGLMRKCISHARRNHPTTSLLPKPPGWTYCTVINPPLPPEPLDLHCCGVADMIAAQEYGHLLESGYVADTSRNFSGGALAHYNSMPSRGFQFLGMYQSLIKLLKHESFLGLYKGNGAGVIRIVPFAAWYFMIIEQYESWILNKCLMLGLGPSINLVPPGNLFVSCAIEFLSAVVKSMTTDSEEGREAVGLLLDLFDYPAAKLMDMLSSNTQNALHFAKAGSFRPLVQCLKEGYDMNKILIATTFSRWEFSDHKELTIADDGVIKPLVKMSSNGKLEPKLSSLNAVQNSSNMSEIVQGLIRSGSTGPLLQLLLYVTFVLMILKEFASIILARSVQADSILVDEDVAKQMLSLLNPSSPIIQGLEALNTLVVHPSDSKGRREINSNHSKATGLAIMIVGMWPHIDKQNLFAAALKAANSDFVDVQQRYVLQFLDILPIDADASLLCVGIIVLGPRKKDELIVPAKHLGMARLGGLGHVAIKFFKAFGLNVICISNYPQKESETISNLGADFFLVYHQHSLNLNLEDKVGFKGEGNVMRPKNGIFNKTDESTRSVVNGQLEGKLVTIPKMYKRENNIGDGHALYVMSLSSSL